MSKKELISYPINILADISPRVAIIKDTFESVCSVSDLILLDKLKRFFDRQDIDFDKQVNWSSNFSKDAKRYQENTRRLVYAVNTMNEDEKIDVFANLMRAFLLNLIDFSLFWRLCDILQKIYIEDIRNLYRFIRK